MKPQTCWEKEDQDSDEENVDDDNENMEILTEGWDDGISEDMVATKSLHIQLMKLAIANEDDPRDEEWILAELREENQRT
ncbi:hypothetical protein C0993_007207 [Termitomyces sp. T159_Od127]|nr:hypothetical protein C0993_007207 [Termitomyces sp. T159_Od127]